LQENHPVGNFISWCQQILLFFVAILAPPRPRRFLTHYASALAS